MPIKMFTPTNAFISSGVVGYHFGLGLDTCFSWAYWLVSSAKRSKKEGSQSSPKKSSGVAFAPRWWTGPGVSVKGWTWMCPKVSDHSTLICWFAATGSEKGLVSIEFKFLCIYELTWGSGRGVGIRCWWRIQIVRERWPYKCNNCKMSVEDLHK